MTDIAIRVENLSKLYPARSFGAGHIGMLQQRHDTTSTVLSAGLRDALTGFLPRITRNQKSNSSNSRNSRQASDTLPRITRISRNQKSNSSYSSNSWPFSATLPRIARTSRSQRKEFEKFAKFVAIFRL